MKKIIFACLLFSFALPLAAQQFESAERQTVVELFTSEGCSSCPPADRWLSSLVNHPDLFKTLFPIAFHVDYWNQLGWYDRFSSSSFSQRERLYKRQGAISQVYTPGVLVNGKEWRGWIRKRQLPVEEKSSGRLSVDIQGQRLQARYSGLLDQKLVLNVAYLGMGLNTRIGAGENSGKSLDHDFVVLDYQNQLGEDEWILSLAKPADFGQQRTALLVWLSSLNQLKPIHIAGGFLY